MKERLYGGAERVDANGQDFVLYGGRLWLKAKVRKATWCWLTDAPILPGDEAYRPLSNGSDRYRRVKASTWDRPAADVLKVRR